MKKAVTRLYILILMTLISIRSECLQGLTHPRRSRTPVFMEKLTVILAANASKQLTVLIFFLGLLLVLLVLQLQSSTSFESPAKPYFSRKPYYFYCAILQIMKQFKDAYMMLQQKCQFVLGLYFLLSCFDMTTVILKRKYSQRQL